QPGRQVDVIRAERWSVPGQVDASIASDDLLSQRKGITAAQDASDQQCVESLTIVPDQDSIVLGEIVQGTCQLMLTSIYDVNPHRTIVIETLETNTPALEKRLDIEHHASRNVEAVSGGLSVRGLAWGHEGNSSGCDPSISSRK